jgi:hypothetical protein
MREMSGQSFDPEVLGAFFAIEDKIKEIARIYSDDTAALPAFQASTDVKTSADMGNPEHFVNEVTL